MLIYETLSYSFSRDFIHKTFYFNFCRMNQSLNLKLHEIDHRICIKAAERMCLGLIGIEWDLVVKMP